MRTGVWLFPSAPAPELVAVAVQAEAGGLDELWLGDEGPAREPFAVLAAAAAATRRLTVGVGVTNPYVRPPALAATTALTIAELAGGAERVVLGLGAGGSLSLEPFGLRPARPVATMREAIATIRAVAAGEAGAGYEPVDHALHGHLALYVGARGERLNRLASAEADGAFVAGIPPFRYEQVLGWVRSVREIEVALYPSVAFDAEDVERSRPQMLWAVADAPAEVRAALGVGAAELDEAARALVAGDDGPARRVMTDERLAEVLLSGPPDRVGRRLAELARRHRPTSMGVALLQEDLPRAVERAIAALVVMRRELDLEAGPGTGPAGGPGTGPDGGADATTGPAVRPRQAGRPPALGSPGVIAHLVNPSPADVRALAVAAEAAGAGWLGLADAFWWRDVWLLLAEAVQATTDLRVGPMATNAYLRHPFHTASALATLAELAGDERVLLGLAAGGSELSGAAGVDRRDAPRRVAELVELLRAVAAGAPLDAGSGRRLDLPLPPVPVVVAARGDGMLRTAGAVADHLLLWAVPDSDLDRTVATARRGGERPRPIWAPLVDWGPDVAAQLDVLACYALLNAGAALRRSWGADDRLVAAVRADLVAGRVAEARRRLPDRLPHDLIYRDADPERLAARGRRLGLRAVAVPAFDVATVGERVAWARAVETALRRP